MSLWLSVPHSVVLILCVTLYFSTGSTFWEIAGGGGPSFGKYPYKCDVRASPAASPNGGFNVKVAH
ncbi:hypothetical protein PR003_g20202 [Phytophthora rubi]|uniref:Uncharacterized protein n=1 Tax=Phytophthora rubi TaxID=129364 RepID=A0A6A4E0W5_9STRA|nr:hypothetical protein PR002_g24240 [Phytophthora rubi]KAE8999502.1 hypothetical protein PR001_g19040 [Phytophthora rubi]KAE9310706.1 hypothetical protein PR003_g20202 [Phytophthora rubi]